MGSDTATISLRTALQVAAFACGEPQIVNSGPSALHAQSCTRRSPHQNENRLHHWSCLRWNLIFRVYCACFLMGNLQIKILFWNRWLRLAWMLLA